MTNKQSPKVQSLFISFYYATLFFGDVASNLQTQLAQVGLYFVGYALSLILIEKRFTTNDFLLKQAVVDPTIKEKILVSGEEIETEEEADVEENRFFRIIEQKNMINKKLFLILYAVFFYLAVKVADGNFQIISILPFLTAIMIVFSATIGHLLIALFFNAIYFTMIVKETPLIFVVIYLVLFLLSLITFTMTSNQINVGKTHKQMFLRNLIGSLIPLVFIVFIVNYFISRPIDTFSFKKAQELNQKAGRIAERSKTIAKSAANKLKSSLPIDTSKPDGNVESLSTDLSKLMKKSAGRPIPKIPESLPQLELEIKENKYLNNNKTLKDTKDLLDKIEQSTELSEADLDKLKNQLANLKTDLSALPTVNESSLNTPQTENGNKSVESKKLKDIISNMEKELKTIKDNPELTKVALKNIKNSIDSAKDTTKEAPTKNTATDTKLDPPVRSTDSSNPTTVNEMAQSKPLNTTPIKKPTPPLIDEKLLKFIFNILSSIIFIGGILFILNFINKFFKKTEYKDLETIIDNEEEEAVIKNELNSLKKMKLSPKEEVMLYYEVVYKILKLYHFPDHEAPPPMEVYDQVKAKHISIQKQLFNVTETFCQSFYGNHPVSKEHLVNFRKSLLPILINFGFKKKLF